MYPEVEIVQKSTHVQAVRRRTGIANERMSSWDVLMDGVVLGTVERVMVTHERRTPGKRYVNARWQSPGWQTVEKPRDRTFRFDCASRTDGVKRLLRKAGLPLDEAAALADTTKSVKVKP